MRCSTKLNLTSLESRDNPAKFAVSTLSPLAGDLGDTGATHSGSLIQSSAYTVDAVDVTAAVKAAFSGGITVSLAGQTTTYAFDLTAGSVGSAYAIQVDGEQVLIGFEDMAGQAGCDYDYNDRDGH